MEGKGVVRRKSSQRKKEIEKRKDEQSPPRSNSPAKFNWNVASGLLIMIICAIVLIFSFEGGNFNDLQVFRRAGKVLIKFYCDIRLRQFR
jgi:hypothetical protein